MADIAMLVAEEYERRVKSSRKASDDDHHQQQQKIEIKMGSNSYVSVLAQRIKDKVEWVLLEPKSQIGLAASDGFFSA